MAKNVARSLPAEYRQVDYIQSDGVAYIDPFVDPFVNYATNIEIVFSPTVLPCWMLGAVMNADVRNDIGISGGAIRKYGYSASYNFSVGSWYSVSLFGYLAAINNVEYPLSFVGNSSTEKYTFYIFKAGGSSLSPSGRIRLCKIYDGSNLIRDYVACVRIADNKAGLYDFANGQFVTSSVGSFIIP